MLVSLAVYCVCLERICGFAGYMADYGRPYSINMFTFFKCLQLYIMSVRH